MLESKNLDENIWTKAMNFSAYIHNRVPHSYLKLRTPIDAYFGKKPNVSNFRVFGSTAWARITLDKMKYLQP